MSSYGEIILGKDYKVAYDPYILNQNIALVGVPGCGKTREHIIPFMMSNPKLSYVIADIKGDLVKKTASFFKKHGYCIQIYNLNDMDKSHSYNPIAYIQDENDCLKLSNAIYGKYTSTDPFWDQSANMLITALICYVVFDAPLKYRTLAYAAKILSECNVYSDIRGNTKCSLDDIFDYLQDSSIGKKYYKQFRTAALKTLQSIIISANAKMYKYSSEQVQKLMSKNEISFEHYKYEKTITYVILNDADDTFTPLADMFFNQILNYFVKESKDLKDGKFEIPIQIILDDFCAYRIDRFEHLIACLRSRNIGITIALQSDTQLVQNYGEAASTTILNCCDTYLYMGGTELETCATISKKLNVPLDEVMYMPLHNSIVIRRGEKPRKLHNFDFNQSIYAKMCEDNEINFDYNQFIHPLNINRNRFKYDHIYDSKN